MSRSEGVDVRRSAVWALCEPRVQGGLLRLRHQLVRGQWGGAAATRKGWTPAANGEYCCGQPATLASWRIFRLRRNSLLSW
jgi:hypothetical protein